MKQKVEPSFIRADLNPSSYKADTNTIDVVFATEMQVLRRTWEGKFFEVLTFGKDNVRLERLNNGGNLLDSHDSYSLSSVIGVVERAWLEGNQAKATIKFSERDEVKGIVADVKAGIIRNISVGYNVYEYVETDKPENETPVYRATDWEPMEISLVCVPADYMSGTRNQDKSKYHEVEFIPKNMDPKNKGQRNEGAVAEPPVTTTATPAPAEGGETRNQPATPATLPAPAAPPVNADEVRSAERTRVSEINVALRAAGIDDIEFGDGLINEGKTIDQARKSILDKLAESQPNIRSQSNARITGDADRLQLRLAMEEVISHRADTSIELTTPKAKSLRNASLMDMAMLSLRAQGHEVDYGTDKLEITKRALSTGDYPILLSNVVNKSLRKYYELASPEWKLFANRISASDFKNIYTVQFGGSTMLEEIKEGGEYKYANMVESGDNFKLKTFGKKIEITRQAIINDDLNGFMRKTQMFANAAVQTEAQVVYGLLLMNNGAGRKLLSDNVFLFDGTKHKNVATTGSVLSLDSLNAARVAMRRQTGLAGEKILVRPKYLVVPPEQEILARQLINSTIVANTTANSNPLQGAFTIIVDEYLDDPKAWYIIADPGAIDVITYAYLNGQEGLYTEQMISWDTDALEIKVRTDFNATIDEYRGIYKNPGPA